MGRQQGRWLFAKESRSPPSGREDPAGVGVEEPPGEDGCGDEEEAEELVAAKDARLVGPLRLLGLGLRERLDAGFDHGRGAPGGAGLGNRDVPDQYRGGGVVCFVRRGVIAFWAR